MRDLFRNVVETGVLTIFTPIAERPGKAIALVGGTAGFARTMETIASLKEMEGSIAAVKSYSALDFRRLKLERTPETIVMVDLDFIDVNALKDILVQVQACTRSIQVIAIYSPLYHPEGEERALKRLAQTGGVRTLTKPVAMAALLETLRVDRRERAICFVVGSSRLHAAYRSTPWSPAAALRLAAGPFSTIYAKSF